MSNTEMPAQFLAEFFAHDYCTECGGDACHHTAVQFNGQWFARCDHPASADGTLAPEILAYRWRQCAAAYPVAKGE